MVKFILGRAGTGKTHRVIREMKESEGELILLVPEQYSHSIERLMCEVAGEEISAKAEVLSFNRLSDRIFTYAGGLANRTVDNGAKILLMLRALNAVKGELRVLHNAAARPEFLENLIEISEELKTCLINPEKLYNLGEGHLPDKLHDIALIATAFDGEFKNGKIDPTDKIKLATEKAKSSGFFKNKKIWVDGYTGFTPQEIELLRVIFAQSEMCTVALCLNEDPEEESGAFSKNWDTYTKLSRIAGDSEIIRLKDSVRYKFPSLELIEKEIFLPKSTLESCDGVEVYTAANAFDECKTVAAKIIQLRNNGFRYRDIAVCARNWAEYEQMLTSVLSRFEIPYYENKKQPVLSQAPITFVLSALKVISDNFRYDDVIAYLKTGLSGVRGRKLDRLEHYIFTWHIEGKKWFTDFTESPSGRNVELSDEDREELLALNRMRSRIVTPLLNLRAAVRENPTGKGISEALFSFFEEINLARRLEARAGLHRLKGNFEAAEMYEGLWQILVSGIQSVVDTHADTRFTLENFTKIFSLMLSQYEIGMIPTSLDRVNVGNIERLGEAPVKCVILVGATDGRLPMYSGESGILSDSERERIEEMGISLAKNPIRRLDDEFRIIYTALSTAGEKLILTVPQVTADGNEAQKSFVVKNLEKLFPKLKIEKFKNPDTYAISSCFDIAALRTSHPWRDSARKYFEEDEKWKDELSLARRNSKIPRGPLRDKENIDAIFGSKIRLSASKTDSFNSCRYQYFLKYGLNLKPQRRASFDALEIGTFIHEILEITLKEIKARGGHKKVTLEEVIEITDIAIDDFIVKKLGNFAGKTARFKDQFSRLRRNVHAILKNVYEELCNSKFEPIDFELKFSNREGDLPALSVKGEGYEVTLEGFVDRVDACTLDDTLYLRVVDYKTGTKAFNINEVLNGLNMQLLLYLFTLCDLGERRYNKKPTPAGVLYMSARDLVYSATGGESDEEIHLARDAKKKRSGLLLDKKELYSEKEFLPIRFKKDGEFDAKSSVATMEEFLKISKRIDAILKNIGSELTNGVIGANPYYKNASESACDFCEMREACHFDTTAGDVKRYLFATKMEDC